MNNDWQVVMDFENMLYNVRALHANIPARLLGGAMQVNQVEFFGQLLIHLTFF